MASVHPQRADEWESGDPGPPDGWDLLAASEAREPAWLPPEVLTAREVCGLPLPEGQEVWGPVLMVGSRLVLGGKKGEGKTTFGLCIVEAVSEGNEFLGWKGCGKPVLIIDLEQGLRTVQRRLRERGLGESDKVDYARIPDGLDLMGDEAQIAWFTALVATKKYALVVLDPLYKAHRSDSNDERAMVDLMRKVDKIRDEQGFSLLIPMHLRKTDPRQATITMDDIFGSGGLTRGAEVVLGIHKLAPGRSMLHFWADRDGDLQEFTKWPLDFTVEGGFVKAPDKEEVPTDILIVQSFARDPLKRMTKQQIVDETGKGERAIRDALKVCLDRGNIVETEKALAHGRKLYELGAIPEDEAERYERMAMEEWE